jgi:hypothetical protein
MRLLIFLLCLIDNSANLNKIVSNVYNKSSTDYNKTREKLKAAYKNNTIKGLNSLINLVNVL